MIIKCEVCKKEYYIRPSDYKRGRRCCSRKCGFKKRKVLKGKEHPNWKFDKVGYSGLHAYIRKLLKKPKLCSICNKREAYDLANISGKYKRDLEDWEWLCRKCHMNKDGRLNNLKRTVLN